jgi:hypothetical protein
MKALPLAPKHCQMSRPKGRSGTVALAHQKPGHGVKFLSVHYLIDHTLATS